MKGLFRSKQADFWSRYALPLSVLFLFFGAGFFFLAALTRSPWLWGMFEPYRAAEDQAENWVAPTREAKAQARLVRVRRTLSEIERLTAKGDFDDVVEESREIRERIEDVVDDIIEVRAAGRDVDDLVAQVEAAVLRLEELVSTAEAQAAGAEKELLEFELTRITSFSVR